MSSGEGKVRSPYSTFAPHPFRVCCENLPQVETAFRSKPPPAPLHEMHFRLLSVAFRELVTALCTTPLSNSSRRTSHHGRTRAQLDVIFTEARRVKTKLRASFDRINVISRGIKLDTISAELKIATSSVEATFFSRRKKKKKIELHATPCRR
ncbi:hypothetical protein PUN28_007891 [Cardiocondyla obscurior]|uniref:Uncharacterized protein n=1 Tax=Cardiocondyla obscurior TaxID=286306 RepID=A0AAW2FWW1_9HYME